jgi:hypothetical protein
MQAQVLVARIIGRAPLHGLCVVLALAFSAAAAHARPEAIAKAVDLCSRSAPNGKEQAGHLSEDRSILCFDGAIDSYLDLTPVLRLKNEGTAVVRSVGGSGPMAMTIADVLWEKNATVVVRNYCLSACANALFVASQQTYVLAYTVVAWHGGPGDCSDKTAVAALKRIYRECNDYGRSFYTKRGLGRDHMIAPPTKQTRDRFYFAIGETYEKRSVFWMWHPANHRSYFKDRVTYEAYPDSQIAVDAIFMGRHFRTIRVIYDHPTD